MNIAGIGTDIVECLRIAKMIEKHGELFLNRVYTDYEIEYCQNKRGSTEHYSGRWAAKEAILKAIGTGLRKGISWRDMEINNRTSGKPEVVLKGGVKDLVDRMGISQILITISHCRTHATATAIALSPEQPDSAIEDVQSEIEERHKD